MEAQIWRRCPGGCGGGVRPPPRGRDALATGGRTPALRFWVL